MAQVNVTISDEAYEILVEESAKRQLISKKVVRIGTIAAELLEPAILALNSDSAPNSAPGENPKTESNKESKPSKGAFDFSALDI